MSTTPITEASLTEQIVKAHAEAAVAAELAAKLPVDFQKLYEEKVEENDRLQNIITSARIASSAPVNKSHKPSVTVARLRATLGDAVFHGMSRNEKLVSLGVDPKVSDDTLRKGWGRGNDGRFASDLMKTNPREYGLLREAAIALNIYGAK
jgi:hypothetical protein